jgi:hypothetical protein
MIYTETIGVHHAINGTRVLAAIDKGGSAVKLMNMFLDVHAETLLEDPYDEKERRTTAMWCFLLFSLPLGRFPEEFEERSNNMWLREAAFSIIDDFDFDKVINDFGSLKTAFNTFAVLGFQNSELKNIFNQGLRYIDDIELIIAPERAIIGKNFAGNIKVEFDLPKCEEFYYKERKESFHERLGGEL